jgi:MFS family permease
VHTVLTLACAQAFAASGLMVVVLMGGVVSASMAPSPAWATAPVSIAVVALALTTIPASMLMRRFGRRAGFMTGAAVGAVGGCVAAGGVVARHFPLFCLGSILLGSSMAFTQQYRFAAAESAPAERASRAISYVLVGSLCAAVIGPQIALAGRHWIDGAEYAGSFLAVSCLYLIAIGILSRVRIASSMSTQAQPHDADAAFRPDATFRTAVFASVVAYAVMSFIMTAAPMHMHVMDHHSMEVATWVIQSHVLAMFLPSLATGRVIERFGERAVMLTGGVLMAACVAVNMSGRQVMHYWWGLVLLGVGWNLLFVAGTTLLTRACQGPGRYRAQAINDFTVFGSQACASLLAGFAVHQLGWTLLNVATIPLIAAMMLGASRLRSGTTQDAAAESPQRAA